MSAFQSGVLLVLMLLTANSQAQSPRTEHTFYLDDPENPPQATLADVAMLVGSWTGTAFGGTFEEVWNPPSADSMVGLFKLVGDGKVMLYEIMLIREEQGSLNLKVKHFSDDFTAWEDKKEYVNFPFIRADDDAVHFAGISFYRINDDEMHAYLVMRSGEDVREEKLVYRRTHSTRQQN